MATLKDPSPEQERGQALVEYVLLLAFLTLVYLVVTRQFKALNVADRLLDPIRNRYANVYRFGHPQAKVDEQTGIYTKHPRAPEGDSIRLFINPEVRQ